MDSIVVIPRWDTSRRASMNSSGPADFSISMVTMTTLYVHDGLWRRFQSGREAIRWLES